MWSKQFYLFCLFEIFFLIPVAQTSKLSIREKVQQQVLENFISYIGKKINCKTDITTNQEMQYIISHFVFLNIKKDTATESYLTALNSSEIISLRRSLLTLQEFFQGRNFTSMDSFTLMPLRLYQDVWIYNHLNLFQKRNTFILLKKGSPTKPICYILLIPSTPGVNDKDLIWSWILEYKFGKFLFISPTGQEGYEYFFSMGK